MGGKGMVEAAGVEPAVNAENTQVTESENSGNVPNSTIAELAYKSRTKIFRNSQNFSRRIFRSEPADDLKSFSLILYMNSKMRGRVGDDVIWGERGATRTTRDLCRDSLPLQLLNDLQARAERLKPTKSCKTTLFVARIVD